MIRRIVSTVVLVAAMYVTAKYPQMVIGAVDMTVGLAVHAATSGRGASE